MMAQYGEVAGLPRRLVVPVPVLSPRLSSLWVGLVTPLPTGLARPLVDSLVNEVIVHDPAITELLPRDLLSYRESVELALGRVADLDVATRWSDAGASPGPVGPAGPVPTDPDWAGGAVMEDERRIWCDATPDAVFDTVAGIGGDRGWYGFGWLWTLRGLFDLAVGGVGPAPGSSAPAASYGSVTPSTPSGPRWSTRPICCGSEPRCGCRARAGSNGRSWPTGPGPS